jgi:hypothetical protein
LSDRAAVYSLRPLHIEDPADDLAENPDLAVQPVVCQEKSEQLVGFIPVQIINCLRRVRGSESREIGGKLIATPSHVDKERCQRVH